MGARSWDPVWDVATSVDSLGWVVEMRIPFSQLRFPQAREQLWGVNFFRSVFRKNQLSQWAFKPKIETGYASRFGHLLGLRDIPAPKRLALLPYTLGRGTHDTPATSLGAAKRSGKTPSGWSVGVLDAVTAREQARFASGGSGWRQDVEPFTNYVVGRVRREVGGPTGFGLLATAVDRRNSSAAL